MNVVGRVESVWRYPVKSMRGEMLPEAYVSFSGVLGDRLYAVHHCGRAHGISVSDGTGRPDMLRYRPNFAAPS